MADIQLERRGSNLRYKTPKLQVTVPAPSQSIIYDQCGDPTGKKVNGSFQISGRVTCFDPVTEILRVSYRYFYNNADADLIDLRAALYGLGPAQPSTQPQGIFVPNPPGFQRLRLPFTGNPRAGIQTSIDGANYPLVDVCDVTIGTVEDKNLQEYGFTPECRSIARYGYTTTVARHASITDEMVFENIAQLGGMFLAFQTTVSTPAAPVADDNPEMLENWALYAAGPSTIQVGAFEEVVAP